ncbi:MAG: glycosyltransferase family 2 protein [Streptococcaceae bacterium]|jgi:glycosyltransferase involved in cell wall biosynthesis|nr:glycosyltransferase family 2 protein [Streptococcaceae bacterium]MCH4176007.1 glycosyltransferase family 2 protein [Streptococcaceae bacterium]
MNQLITVILPVYNGEKYLNRAIDSVINQTLGFHNVCLLAINDGGQDTSLEILQDYHEKFPELIQVINQENQGVAKTRNQAIQLVKTPYLTFLDQDDYFDLDFLETLYRAAVESGAEVVSSGMRRPDNSGKVHQIIQPADTAFGKYIIVAAWAKLHRTDLLINNQIEFFDNQYGEDNVFTVKEIMSAKKWTIINYTGYNWFYNQNSVSNTKQKGLSEDDQFIKVLQKNFQNTKTVDNLFIYFMIRTTVFYLLFSGRTSSSTRFIKIYNELFGYLSQIFTENRVKSVKVPKGEKKSTGIIIKIFLALRQFHMMNIFAKFYCRGESIGK